MRNFTQVFQNFWPVVYIADSEVTRFTVLTYYVGCKKKCIRYKLINVVVSAVVDIKTSS